MPKNISISFSGIIIICNLFNRLNRNTASRVISLFEMPIEKTINFARLFCTTNVLRKSSFLEIYKFGQHIACHNLLVGNPNRKKMHIFGFVGIFEYIC